MAEFNESEDKPPNGNVNGESREQDPPPNDLSSIEVSLKKKKNINSITTMGIV